jgi:asparagine synthase (glutamine-hydrolysing)
MGAKSSSRPQSLDESQAVCGIFAIFDQSGGVERRTLELALSAMAHRGPDGRGVFLSIDGRVGLGHARLSIIDLVTGDQPLQSESKEVSAVVNGEFYGFIEARRQLEARGHQFRTGSDSEILIHLYEDHGVDCLRYLRGEFAFVLWDAKDRRLFAARDRFGVKPLFFAECDQRITFASEAAALFAAGVEAAWDGDAFFHAAHIQYTPLDRTLFAGVGTVEPGCFVLVENGRRRVERYWDLDFPRAGEREEKSEEFYVEAVRYGLETAVEHRMFADVPVAYQLSGGLDSSAVAGIAAHFSPKPIDCFTVSFGVEPYDELHLAQETAAALGAHLHVVEATPIDLARGLPLAVVRTESLVVNAHVSAKLMLSRAVRDAGFKVILAGEGADEVFAGYPHFRFDALAGDERALSALLERNPVSAGVLLPDGVGLDTSAVLDGLGFVPGFLRAKATLGERHRALLDPDFVDSFRGRDVYRELIERVDVAGQLRGRHRVHQSMYLWAKLALPAYLLRIMGDGAEMAHSVEGRLPFLDHALFDVVKQTPVHLLIREGVEKYVLRRAARDRLTPALYGREKHPFFAPPLAGLGSPALAWVHDMFQSEAFRSVPFYAHEKVRALFRRACVCDAAEARRIDPLIMMAISATALTEHFRL